jgi:hypothetical protein
MADFHPRCPKCDKPMDPGHVPDVAHCQVLRSCWAPREPEVRRYLGGIKYRAKELIPLSAYRCPDCGYVELYARPD